MVPPAPPEGAGRPETRFNRLKARLRDRFPATFLALRRLRRMGRSDGLDAETRGIAALLCGDSLRVMSGPFAGMPYIGSSASGLLPKLAGCYEAELHGVVSEMVASDPKTIVNIGSGEGYYTVGLGRLLPNAELIAYDLDPLARDRLRMLARINGLLGRLTIRTACSLSSLRHDLVRGGMVVSDCEGFEKELLDPDAVPALRDAHVLVEVHDFADPTISSVLGKRFSASHALRWIEPGESPSRDLPGWDRDTRGRIVYEGRVKDTSWCWMIPTSCLANVSPLFA